ncbi:DUF3084 domain-containing protein [Pectinatus frisingensis]|uniref:DUF3084 domain-containing protein n=1 Tax=Pectinatus frisingensis TaxID=865 RepID=UPI0018C4EB29|nr:DUF3084 domain-containing protein [Pectinatus frisingensis]
MHGIVLIVVLVMVGGIIAFIGDRLGSKVGKKKMTLFGLRPRHTSIIVTIVTGIAITTMTFGILAVTSKDVRTALFGMEKLQQKIRITQDNLNDADNNLQSARQEQQQMQFSLGKTRNALNEAETQTEKLKQYQGQLLADNSRLEGQNDALEGQNSYLTATNGDLQKYNNELMGSNSLLQDQNDNLLKRNGDLSSKRIIYQAGELIFGGVIPATTDWSVAQESMSKLIALANTRILGKAEYSASRQNGLWINPTEYEDALSKICSSDKDMVVRFIAASNLVKDEPIRSNIELYPDRNVYSNGEMITNGEFVTDGTQAMAQQILLNFLHDINTIASANGVLPDPLRGSIGVISMNQLYDVTDAMVGIKGKILLTAYSRGDTNILGPLRLIIKVEKINED